MPKKYKNPELQQLKKHQRLQFLTKNDFDPDTGAYVERQKVNGETWRLQIASTRVKDFLWLASRARNKISLLKLIKCQVDSWQGLQQLKELRVLDISQVDLSEGLPAEIASLSEMRALIAAECQLKTLEHIEGFSKLNTLILNRNELTRLPGCLGTFSELEKISVSKNELKGKHLPDLTGCTALKQVRLSHNTKLKTLPEHFGRWTKGEQGLESRLECLYLASTGLKGDECLDQIFQHSGSLTELAVSNTPLVKEHETLYEERCKAALPKLKVYNTVRFDELHQRRRDVLDRKELRAQRKAERQANKAHKQDVLLQEIRLLKADKPLPPPKPALPPDAQAALAEKKREKRQRKKERHLAEVEARKGDRIRAGLPPLPELPPGVSKFSRKSQLPPKAERKARKERKRAERSQRKFEQRQATRMARAAKAAAQEGQPMAPQTNGVDAFAGNGDFVAFDAEPAQSTSKSKVKRERSPAQLNGPNAVEAEHAERPSKRARRDTANGAEEESNRKKEQRSQTADDEASSQRKAARKDKKPKMIGGSLAADDASISAPCAPPEAETDRQTSVVGIVEVSGPRKRRKAERDTQSGDAVEAFLIKGGDKMADIRAW